ncbi:MAG TPA: CPBP family intramembrane metalloprotease [Aggregatilineales bacterium]|nr:CPBP family intramembrane metalloprotease [Aggregatilineales bacterium]
MNARLDTRRILIYLLFSFGIAWAIALVIYLTGGLASSPTLVEMPGAARLTLATLLLAAGYMWAPALAHILTRVVTREGWADPMLRPRLRQGWPYWLAAIFLPAVLTIIGAVVYFLLFPQHYDPELGLLRSMLPAEVPIPLGLLVAIQIIQGILLSQLINSLFTFGEEFGWRGYLQPKLMPLGGRRAMLLMGVIWGLWHAPVIAMGHNYGFGYPGAPWTGILAMIWFTTVAGTFLGWASLRGESVWPAVLGHAGINGIASLAVLFTQGEPNPLLGPLPVGLIGSAGFTLLALWLFISPRALARPEPGSPAIRPAPTTETADTEFIGETAHD